MRYLLDTNALLWWLEKSPRLRTIAYEIIASRDNQIHVSPISVWEVAVKSSVGKLDLQADLLGLIRKNRFIELPITLQHAFKVKDLPLIHKDPFDRLLIAQAMTEELTIITSDGVFERYGVCVLNT